LEVVGLSESIVTKLRLVGGYSFGVEFDLKEIPSLIVDEVPPAGKGLGPNPTRLLSAAVGHCLSSSLLYCLSRAKIEARSMETTVKTNIARNEEGRLRVQSIEAEIRLDVDEKDKPRLPRCLEIFENYCTVTSSVRKGIEVKVNVV
jgi:organic hydroperoxide reductase OsmC/OhrA